MKMEDNKYELMVIISSEIGSDAVNKRLEAIKKTLEKHGEIFFEDIWGERDLAYAIKKQNKGHYAVFDFEYKAEKIVDLETMLRLEPEVLRHLIVKLPIKYQPKTASQLRKSSETAEALEEAKE